MYLRKRWAGKILQREIGFSVGNSLESWKENTTRKTKMQIRLSQALIGSEC